jgi:hypothetical protein
VQLPLGRPASVEEREEALDDRHVLGAHVSAMLTR